MRHILFLAMGLLTALVLAAPVMAAPNLGFGKDKTGKEGLAQQIGRTAQYDVSNADTALSSTVGKIISVALSIMGTLFLALMVYGGIVWMLARGEETEITKAKEIIKAAVIGLIITLAAYAISNFVVSSLLKATSGSDVGSSSSGSDQQTLPQPPTYEDGGSVPYFEATPGVSKCPNFKTEEVCLFDPAENCAWNPGNDACEPKSSAWSGTGAQPQVGDCGGQNTHEVGKCVSDADAADTTKYTPLVVASGDPKCPMGKTCVRF